MSQGDRILLMMDANEHVKRGIFGNALENIGLFEAYHVHWGRKEPNTHIDGSIPIDGAWATSNLEIKGFKTLPFSESVGDHRTMIFDVTSRSLLGKFEYRIVRKACRRLNKKNPKLVTVQYHAVGADDNSQHGSTPRCAREGDFELQANTGSRESYEQPRQIIHGTSSQRQEKIQKDYKTGATIQWTSKAVARDNSSLKSANPVGNRAG